MQLIDTCPVQGHPRCLGREPLLKRDATVAVHIFDLDGGDDSAF